MSPPSIKFLGDCGYVLKIYYLYIVKYINISYRKFVDAVAHGDKFAGSPNEAVHFDGLDSFEHCVHVGLIVPGFAVEQHRSLGDEGRFFGLFGSIGVQPFLADFGSLFGLLFFVVRAKKIDIVIIVVVGSSWGST